MRFKSPTEQPIFLALTSGHTCTIGPEYVEIDERFHRQAVVHGAIPEGTEHVRSADAVPEPTRRELLLAAVRQMVNEARPEDFTADGKVNANALSQRVGFTVSSSERDSAWDIVAKEHA
jgi:hypothetical protein